MRDVPALVQEAHDAIAQAQRNTAASLPKALDGVSGDGLIALAQLRVMIYPMLAQAEASSLLRAYSEGLTRGDARGLVEAQIIEELVTSGAPLAKSLEDTASSKALRDHVEGVMELRTPTLPDFDLLASEYARLEARATVLDVGSVDPERDEQAASVYDRERDAIQAAGAATDADDQAALAGRAVNE